MHVPDDHPAAAAPGSSTRIRSHPLMGRPDLGLVSRNGVVDVLLRDPPSSALCLNTALRNGSCVGLRFAQQTTPRCATQLAEVARGALIGSTRTCVTARPGPQGVR
jgi:hypothetical protein